LVSAGFRADFSGEKLIGKSFDVDEWRVRFGVVPLREGRVPDAVARPG
jgi:hypothetical protein